MIKRTKLILTSLLLSSTLCAVETTLTNISFVQDEEGNLNPYIFIPFYYGASNQFYSAVGYTSGTTSNTDVIEEGLDSKYSSVVSRKDLTINYFTYVIPLSMATLSVGVGSLFTQAENNEFGYIDLAGTYNSIENRVNLDAQIHYIELQVMIPLGNYVNSRISTTLSPYTVLQVENKTTFKPSVTEEGVSNSSKVQDISYTASLELQTNLDFFANFGFTASYSHQPVKYDTIAVNSTLDAFEPLHIDTNEVRTKYLAKVIFDLELLGGLNPSIGYGIEYLDTKNNITGSRDSSSSDIFTLGIEKRF